MVWGEAPIWASAYGHGFGDDEIRHALRNFVAFAPDPENPDVTLFLGPKDETAVLIEVGVLDTEEGPVIIHAMEPKPSRIQRRFDLPKD